MIRAASLKVNLYEEVEADKGATLQALGVVLIAALASGVGVLGKMGPLGVVILIAESVILWGLWAWLNYFIGSKLLKEPQTEADWGQLLRTMGFAYTPQVLAVLVLLPSQLLGIAIVIAITVWKWMAMVIAVRQALDYKSTWRAAIVTLAGALITGTVFSLTMFFLGQA